MLAFRILTVVEVGKSGNETGGQDGEMTLTVIASFGLLLGESVMVEGGDSDHEEPSEDSPQLLHFVESVKRVSSS